MATKTIFPSTHEKPQSQFAIGANIRNKATGSKKTGFLFFSGGQLAVSPTTPSRTVRNSRQLISSIFLADKRQFLDLNLASTWRCFASLAFLHLPEVISRVSSPRDPGMEDPRRVSGALRRQEE